jgi:hypothetical protein
LTIGDVSQQRQECHKTDDANAHLFRATLHALSQIGRSPAKTSLMPQAIHLSEVLVELRIALPRPHPWHCRRLPFNSRSPGTRLRTDPTHQRGGSDNGAGELLVLARAVLPLGRTSEASHLLEHCCWLHWTCHDGETDLEEGGECVTSYSLPTRQVTVPPIRARLGDGPRPQIPLTYPSE